MPDPLAIWQPGALADRRADAGVSDPRAEISSRDLRRIVWQLLGGF